MFYDATGCLTGGATRKSKLQVTFFRTTFFLFIEIDDGESSSTGAFIVIFIYIGTL